MLRLAFGFFTDHLPVAEESQTSDGEEDLAQEDLFLMSDDEERGSIPQASTTDNTRDIDHEDNLNESADNVECLKKFVEDNPDLFEVDETSDEEFDAWEAFDIDTDEEFGC